MSKKRIAILSDKFPPNPGGGIASAHYNLYRLLKTKGYDAHVFTYLENWKEVKNISLEEDITRITTPQSKLALKKIVAPVKNMVKKTFGGSKGDKGIAYQAYLVKKANMNAGKLNRAIKRFNPSIIFLPDFGVPGLNLEKPANAKIFYISHHNPVRFLNNPLLPLHSSEDAYEAIDYEKKALNKVDLIICPSQYMKNVFEETFFPEKDVHVIPNIIDDSFIETVEKKSIHNILGIPEYLPIVYIPSAASNIKGSLFVAEIVRRISKRLDGKVAFYLSGGITDNQKYLFDHIPGLHLFIPGKVDYETNIAYIKSCDLCVSPTLLESFGMAILEAMFCDVPFVSFNVGGNKEILDDFTEQSSVDYLDIETMIEKAIHLLNDDVVRLQLLNKIKRHRKKFEMGEVFSSYEKILNFQ